MKTNQDSLAAHFLLGKLGEKEALKIEEDFFNNKILFEEILAAETELIDAYATNALSPDDRSRFESRLLLNTHQRRRLQFAEMLAKYAFSQVFPAEASGRSTARTSWFAAASQLFSGKRTLSLSFSLAALILFAGVIWFVLDKKASEQNIDIAGSQTPQTSPPREITNETTNNTQNAGTEPNASPAPQKSVQTPAPKNDKPRKKEAPVIYSLILSPGLTRNGGASHKFTVPAKTDFVKMGLKFEQGGFAAYHAALETVEGEQIWSSNKLKARASDKSVEISIPAKLLKKSDYILTLKGIGKNGVSENVESYAFTVNR